MSILLWVYCFHGMLKFCLFNRPWWLWKGNLFIVCCVNLRNKIFSGKQTNKLKLIFGVLIKYLRGFSLKKKKFALVCSSCGNRFHFAGTKKLTIALSFFGSTRRTLL